MHKLNYDIREGLRNLFYPTKTLTRLHCTSHTVNYFTISQFHYCIFYIFIHAHACI